MNLDDCFSQGLLRKINPDMENARRSIEISKEYLEKAMKNEGIECYDVAVILCYTSMFHAARSILFRDGIKERSHVCIPLYIQSRYPELERYANILDSYREFRHRIMYRLGISIDKNDADEAIKSAEEFLSQTKELIGI
ncbi:MAG: HEPN domain-containing protein [Methanocellales archaeon]|nr:HEPN domain-containing protein [Methanocellales archaeon]MDD3291033.1 HEPN domain-containing protein [Methanocellales archaeon]MDD5234918.1 HEPN domain-containing protein [Methanocellales archaeon]MDD5484712.1 HEPN domain-containing protein [Methanocellales archaeon]